MGVFRRFRSQNSNRIEICIGLKSFRQFKGNSRHYPLMFQFEEFQVQKALINDLQLPKGLQGTNLRLNRLQSSQVQRGGAYKENVRSLHRPHLVEGPILKNGQIPAGLYMMVPHNSQQQQKQWDLGRLSHSPLCQGHGNRSNEITHPWQGTTKGTGGVLNQQNIPFSSILSGMMIFLFDDFDCPQKKNPPLMPGGGQGIHEDFQNQKSKMIQEVETPELTLRSGGSR